MLYINMVYTYYMVCVLIEQLVAARPPKKLKRHTLPLTDSDFHSGS